MKSVIEYINESKKFTLKDIKDYTFSWIKMKNPNAYPGEPRYNFSLVCTPTDKTKELIVFRDFAWYKGGYDQGHASSRKYYLCTITSGERGNGHGCDKEYEPSDYDLRLDSDVIECYLSGEKDKYYSKSTMEKLDKKVLTFPYKTKVSEIKNQL